MNENKLSNLKKIFKFYPQIKLVYLFGSRAKGKTGPLSDYDFAFYIDEKDKKKVFELKFKLMDEITNELKTDKVDIIMLDTTEGPEIKYNIIKEGKLIYGKEPYKILIEPKIFNEYFDFISILKRHNLTKVS
ncbi:MAG: nucleotidyltransferase domain-containing protein [Patescibacteria group bacterium]